MIDTAKPPLTITIKSAQRLRYACRGGRNIVSSEEIMKILDGEKKPAKEKSQSITLKSKSLEKYFGDLKSKKLVTEKIEQSLQLTEITIPQILDSYGIEDMDYESIVANALKRYYGGKNDEKD